MFRVVSPFKNLDLNHAFIEVEIHKLSHDIVAFPCVNQAHASVAISPEWLISSECDVNGLVNFIVLSLTHMISCIRNTYGLRHVFLQDELDLTATVAIVDQATVETVQIVCRAELNTDVADEKLD